MEVIVLSASPNIDGLTAACADAAARGAAMAGATVARVRLNDLRVGSCRACGDGWGTCRSEHRCQVEDDFQRLHAQVANADALVLVTPVYFGEMSESAKAFTDRLRRCEATRGNGSALSDKSQILVAAAGGGGGGTVTCLHAMERWARHVRARVFDLVPVTKWTRAHKLQTIQAAAQALVADKA
jgi:multimeric flavodoxin WrbA